MSLTFAEKGKQMGATLFTPCPKWETFRVDDAKILWQPGVFGGNGDENRVNVCLQSPEGEARIQDFEKCLRNQGLRLTIRRDLSNFAQNTNPQICPKQCQMVTPPIRK